MNTGKVQLAAKIETVEGAAETLAGADALLVMNPSFKPNTAMNKRPNVSSSLSPFAAVAGARSATIEFDVEVKGSGTPGTAPEWGKLMKACGYAETIVTSPASVTYTPTSVSGGSPVSIPTLTMALYEDGICNKIWGARGDVSLKEKTGEIALWHFVFTGADFGVTDAAMLSSGVSYQSTLPPVFANASFAVDSYSAVIENLEIRSGNSVSLRPDVNASSGYRSAVISGREPVLTFDPEMVTVATYDFYGKLRSGNEGAFSQVLGSVAGNIITITAPKVQYMAINPADRNKQRTLGIDCQLNRNTAAGDDELSIALT